jgi:glycosyltransferase involved in cell wall biosynthesis
VRILHVIPAVAPRYGGPSRVIFEMSRALRGVEAEILIATTNADGPGELDVEIAKPTRFQEMDTIFFPVTLSERFGYSPQLSRWVKQNVRNFDVVHIHAIFSHSSLVTAKACRSSDVPYVVRPLGSLDPWSMNQGFWRKHILWHASVKQMLKGAAAIHYTTKEEQQLAENSLGLQSGVVIPLGVEMNTAAASEQSNSGSKREAFGGLYVLSLSRLHPKKNLESLIKAFAVVTSHEELSHWRLMIAGDGEQNYVDGLKHLVVTTGAEKRIILTGWLSGADREAALRNAQLLALTSLQENFGLCVAEAFSYSVPVVISDRVNLASEVESANGGWVTGLRPEQIESALRAAMTDAAERVLRGRAARNLLAPRFSWATISADLIDLYRAVVSEHHAQAVLPAPPVSKLRDQEEIF